MNTKKFHLGYVLSVTTGLPVSPRHTDGVYDILNFMTGENLFTHQLPRASEECKPYLLAQFPWLDSPEVNTKAVGELTLMLDTEAGKQEPDKLILGWLSKLVSGQYGIKCEGIDDEMMLPVRPLPQPREAKNPISGLAEMVNPKKIIVVQVPE